MTPFQKNLQRFFIFFFTAISAVILIVGINRVRKTPLVTEVPTPPSPSPTPTLSPTPETTLTQSTVKGSTVSYAGKTYQTPYGNASAAIKIQDGKIIEVSMPQVPNSPPSLYAKPYLIDQALKAGSANIQGVSGATYTSLAFKSSLESAIAQANTQGQTVQSATNASRTPASTPKPSVPRQYRNDDEFEFFRD